MITRLLALTPLSVAFLTMSNWAFAQARGRGRLSDDPTGDGGWGWLVMVGLFFGGMILYSIIQDKRVEKEREEKERLDRIQRRIERQESMTEDERHNDSVLDVYAAVTTSERLKREVHKMSDRAVKRELRDTLRNFEAHDNRAALIEVLEHEGVEWKSLGEKPYRLRDDLQVLVAAMTAVERFGGLKTI